MNPTPGQASPDLWTQFLDWLSRIITPNWTDVINWIPLGLLALLVLVIFVVIPATWLRYAAVNRSRVPRRTTGGAPPAGVHMPGASPWPFVVPIGAALVLVGLVVRPTDARGEPTAPLNLPLFLAGLAITFIAAAGWIRDAMREWRRIEGLERDEHGLLLSSGAAVAALPRAVTVPPRRAYGPTESGGLASAGEAATHPLVVAPVEPPAGAHLPGPSPWPFFAPIGVAVALFGLVFHPAVLVAGILMTLIAATGAVLDAGREFRFIDAGHAPEPRTRDPERAFRKPLLAAYVLIGVLALVAMAVPGLIAFANSSGGQTGEAGAAAGASPSGEPGGGPTTVHVVAKGIKFDTDRLEVPADKPFTIEFDNQDEAVPHNVTIYLDPGLAEPHFTGKIIDGPAKASYSVAPLPAGEYPFICIVHPNMKGTVVAR
jgi:plastocyanin